VLNTGCVFLLLEFAISVNSVQRYSISLHAMLYLIGLGLADETDITVKGLEVVKTAERVYLEAYTSILLVDKAKLVSLLVGL